MNQLTDKSDQFWQPPGKLELFSPEYACLRCHQKAVGYTRYSGYIKMKCGSL